MKNLASTIAISSENNFIKRAQLLATSFEVPFFSYPNEEAYSEQVEQHERSDFIVLSALDSENQQQIAGKVQVVKFVAAKSTIVVVVEKKVTSEMAAFVKKSGANIILLEEEFFDQSKIEFIFSQKSHGSMIPIKSSEFVSDTDIPFPVMHLLPLNHKFLQVVAKGQRVDQAKLNKMSEIGEFYINRDDLDEYTKYINKYQDLSAKGLKSRCRNKFQNLVTNYKDFVNLLTDRSEMASFEKGRDLLNKCRSLSQDLVTSLAETGAATDVVNTSSIDDFSPLDRAPAIAAYAGIYSLMANIGQPDEVMIAALLADIGLLELQPKAVLALKKKEEKSLDAFNLKIYQQHPVISLRTCLSRKLPIPDKLKDIILCTHERPDRLGFPNKPRSEKIPMEASLIQLSEAIDQATLVEFGKPRVSGSEVAQQFVKNEIKTMSSRFPILLLEKLKNTF